MQKNGNEPEAKYLSVICNWRKAIDERGVDESERQRFLQEYKTFICEDLMPWYSKGMKDFSLLEVNRYINIDVCYMYLWCALFVTCT